MKEHYSPFSSPLEKSGIEGLDSSSKNHIHQLRDDPERIIREVRSSSIFLMMEKQEVAAIAKKEFDMLRDKYGIHTNAQYVIAGNSKGGEILYGVTDRIHEDKVDQHTLAQAEGVLTEKLLTYYRDKLRTFDPENNTMDDFLHDIVRSDQYVYGHTADDASAVLHLVDIDPEHISVSFEQFIATISELSENLMAEHIQWARQNGKSLKNITKPLQEILRMLSIFEDSRDSRGVWYTADALKGRIEKVFL